MLNILLFYSTYFGGIAYALFRVPVFAFLVYQAVYFFNPQKRWWGPDIINLSYSYYTVVLMAGLVVINWNQSKANKLFATPQTKWILLYLGMHILAFSYAASPIKHEIFTTFFIKLLITMLIAYKLVNSSKELYCIILGYVFGAWYLSFYVFQIGRNSGDRVEGIGTVDSPDSNGIAAALAPAIVFGIYYLWRAPTLKLKLLALGALAFLANAIVLINSRGAVLGVAGGAMYFMYDLFKGKIKSKYQKATVILLCLVGLIGLSVVIDDGFIERFSSMKEESRGVNTEAETGSSRVAYWKAAFQLALDHPLGTGAYGFHPYAAIYIPADTFVGQQLRATGGVKSVHSSWFSTIAEVGFPGLFFLIMIIFSCFATAKKLKKLFLEQNNVYDYYLASAMQGALITFMITMSFLDRHRAEVFYWLILFFMCAHNVFLVKNKK